METNYELKHKCLLVPLKAVLLVLAMVLVGFTTYAQQGKAVRVANDQQLTEALRNPSIGVIELEPGFYASVNYTATSGTTIRKAPGGGNRNLDCQYYIYDANVCTNTAFPWDGDYPPPGIYIASEARAGSLDPLPFPGCGCCPGINEGSWSYRANESILEPGDTLYFIDPLNSEEMDFFVTGPGAYQLRYSWGAPFNSYVQSEYVFRGPNSVELTAPDVCGETTTVDFTLVGLNIFTFDVDWSIKNLATNETFPYVGPQETNQFDLTVPYCGIWEITAVIHTHYDETDPEDCADVKSIVVEFSCDPFAVAGPDVNVCNELCADINGLVGVYGEVSPDFAYSWVNISGPEDQILYFDPQSGVVPGDASTIACTAQGAECAYGEYKVQLQVQNGLCYADSSTIVRFYEQPDAIAGPDQHLCNTFEFQLDATPYIYCGEEGVNYWSESYWVVVSPVDPLTEITFDPDIYDPNAIVTITSESACPYGEYEFKWIERNAKPNPEGGYFGGCYDEDFVSVFIYEDPVISAGDNMVLCNTFEFQLFGTGDEPCYENTVVKYNWEKTAEPGNCDVVFYESNELNPTVVIDNCDPEACEYGKYTFEFTQCNGYNEGEGLFNDVCCTSDSVDVWILEQPAADAGPDRAYCYSFSFGLEAVPTDFCGEPGVNYFTWGVWTEAEGNPAPVEFSDINDPNATVTILTDDIECPYGNFNFIWTEYNGFGEGEGFEGCVDQDDVTITIYETPDVKAGKDLEFCDTWNFQLNGTIDIPCTELGYRTFWQLIQQPGDCYVDIMYPYDEDPFIYIRECDPCQYGEYIFRITQQNGYWTGGPEGAQTWVTVCEDTDEVSVWIYETPENVNAGSNQNLCDQHEFTLTGTGSQYCGEYGVNYFNYFEWTLESQPAGADCEVAFDHAYSLITDVTLDCAGDCPYGKFVFKLTERNGRDTVWCEASDTVSIYIFETPIADGGDDIAQCVEVGEGFEYCGDMTASLTYCYSMYGQWSKSCGPGNVVFEDINDQNSGFCIDEPGRYKFVWTVWNDAEGCEAFDEVVFDLIETPVAYGEYDALTAECDSLCIDLGLAYIDKYVYIGEEWDGQDPDACPNYWDNAYWEKISGPGAVTFADDTDPNTDMCVTVFGCYTVRWNEVNKSIDGEVVCSDYFDVFVQFVETPDPYGGEDQSLCDKCTNFDADPYIPENCTATDVVSYWDYLSYTPPMDPCPTDNFSIEYSAGAWWQPTAKGQVCVFDDCLGSHYGTYGFVWVNGSGECVGKDTVYIEFKKKPEPVALEGYFNPSNCYDPECPNCYKECMYPNEEVLEVCAGSCLNWSIDWGCSCFGAPIPGYTYEWSFIGPAGSYMSAEPYWYDCDDMCWRGTDYVNICFGECCDTARLYLTITAPNGCTTTEEWKFYVNHKPCAEIDGPAISEVGAVTTYCNVCPEDYDMSCLLYTWTAEHCGQIVEGQGTECIDVLWTNYNVNGGWGEITLTTYDTCTGCCNYDYMSVKIHPAGTLGDGTLSGHVTYANNYNTPLNGVEITLWNGNVPVFTTESFNDIEGGNGPGYYEFAGISAATNFGITATYGAPWYGANATDALAAELYWANGGSMPSGFVTDEPVLEAMDVNNLSGINGTDALWIKQRAIGMVGYFPAGDWAYVPAMSSTAGVYDIPVLNVGDANRSNIPNSMKSMPAIDLVTDGTMNVVTGEVFDLPIRLEKADVFGAITLSLDYNPSLIEVVDVNAVEGLLSNISNNSVSIAWSHVNPMVLADNDIVVTLKVKALSEIANAESLFSIGMNSEFADASAKVVEPVRLKTFGVTTGPAATDYFLAANRPNPFSTSTTIEYTLPETGKVKLSVLDMLGQELEVLVEATQNAGTYSVEYSAAGLATGVYLYKITVDGESRDYISTQRMVVSH